MYGIRSTKSNTTSANSLASPSDSAPLSTSFLECFKAVKDQDGCIIYYFGFINILYNMYKRAGALDPKIEMCDVRVCGRKIRRNSQFVSNESIASLFLL